MKTTSSIESDTSPVPGVIPEPTVVHDDPAPSRQGNRRAVGPTNRPAARRTPLARLLAALRGDKYMVDAYPPGQPPAEDG
jgi:hypothetical protein